MTGLIDRHVIGCIFRGDVDRRIGTIGMTGPQHNPPAADLRPLAALLAWVLPGLGHWFLGQRVRAIRVMIGLWVLILGGLLIGGLDAVDRKRDNLWFLVQMGCGPVVLVADVANQQLLKSQPEEAQYATRGLGHINSAGTLYIALAGLMNLIVMLDALYPIGKRDQQGRVGDQR